MTALADSVVPSDAANAARSQLRVVTAGSVDDGKSTLIGRLLHDTKTIFEDQLDAVMRASRRYGDRTMNLALLTDGLRAEREQGITIDVAYRYFATPVRSFVLIDAPGHVQYTRNMVTGASIADVAIVLVDARAGAIEQTRRHLGIAALLRVPHVVLVVNKMDLVGWDHDRFRAIEADVRELLVELRADLDLLTVPVSALHGDNVASRSDAAPWYDGPALLELLEALDPVDDFHLGARLAVQWTIRAGDYRGYAGSLVGGALHVGQEIDVLPSGQRSTIAGLTRAGVSTDRAEAGDAIAVELTDHVDAGRGDVIVVADAETPPSLTVDLVADVCWLDDAVVEAGRRFVLKHLARQVRATLVSIVHRLDPADLRAVPATTLAGNDLGRVRIVLDEPIVADRYADHRQTGHFVLIDPASNLTIAAGMIEEFA